MATKKMGFEGEIFYGAAGTTAPTKITNSRDIAYVFETEDGDTTVRGDGTVVPIETSRPVIRRVSLEWQMTMKSDDTTLSALLTAAYACTPVAIKTVPYTGANGFDGDVYLTVRKGKPLRGEQTLDFSAKPTDENRTPTLHG